MVKLTVHPPEFDLAVVGAGHDERQVGVEAGPVDPAVVALEYVLDDGVGRAEQVGLTGLEVVLESTGPRSGGLLTETCRGIRWIFLFLWSKTKVQANN